MEFNSKEFVRNLTGMPGVYRMLDAAGKVIYVGKAANLKKRVSSYFGRSHATPKTRTLISHIANIEVTVTRTEGEALLLENNLIKEYLPRYNVMFRDDKSYPYLYLSMEHDFPRLSFYRGPRKGKGRYFGPFPSAGAARQTLHLAQKLFQVRQCNDTFYRNRRRPCLQYQIKRCTAPCVGYIDKTEYARSVEHTMLFLKGKNETVIKELTGPMQRAAEALDFERAAQYRDQISSLRRIQEQQLVTTMKGNFDIIACAIRADQACVQVFFIREGRNLGNKVFFPTHSRNTDPGDILSAFLTQYYLVAGDDRYLPPKILLSHAADDQAMLEAGLSQQSRRRIKLLHRVRGEHARWVKMASENAEIALTQRLSRKQSLLERLTTLGRILHLGEIPERIECFDISHTGGKDTVAACVVYGTEGAVKTDYRRYNIEGITPGDDYAAMRQAIERRYLRIKKEEGKLPDLILIDGGKGQVSASREILQELQLDDLPVVGIAKGPSRKPGLETLILANSSKTFTLPATSSALHLIQEIRDEAHRFAITGHRQRRKRQQDGSPLEQIDGIGSKRRQQIIRHFGGMQGVERAGIDDLAKVPGINKNLATKIYYSLHNN
jgi:excinuclease ABC subunit C